MPAPSNSLCERADGQDFVSRKAFDVRFRNRHGRNRFSEGVEDLQHAPGLSPLGMRDIVDQDSYVSSPEVVLREITLQGDALVESHACHLRIREILVEEWRRITRCGGLRGREIATLGLRSGEERISIRSTSAGRPWRIHRTNINPELRFVQG